MTSMKEDMPLEYLEEQRRILEDNFFVANDKVLIENLKRMKKMQESKSALAEVSGITNDALLAKLVELQIRPETVAALAMIPLVEVAWADGSVSKEEEAAIFKAAEASGVKGDVERELLRGWLSRKPQTALLDAWSHYIADLCSKLSTAEKASLKSDLIGHARAVAEASGGILGIGAVSKEEKAMLKTLEEAFK
jgi:hypothetical protein